MLMTKWGSSYVACTSGNVHAYMHDLAAVPVGLIFREGEREREREKEM